MRENVKNVAGCFVVVFLIVFVGLWLTFGGNKETQKVELTPPQVHVAPIVELPKTYEIAHQAPEKYLSYDEVKNCVKDWNKTCPEITEYGVYGHNRKDDELFYLRVGTPGCKKVLIHACLHGDERLGSCALLGIMGRMLHDYGRDEDVTWLIKNREIYFVPVFSPESYLKSRHIEQGDPNRGWAYPGSKSDNTSSPIEAMKKFVLEKKFDALVDCHTFGEIVYFPSILSNEDKDAMKNLTSKMGELSGYNNGPIGRTAGYAIDWYYWKTNSPAVLIEFADGPTHNMPIQKVAPEVEKTYKMLLYFIREAPEIKLKGVVANNNTPENKPQLQPLPNRRIFRIFR